MRTMEELRHRIGNVQDVQSIVTTMKTMAAVQIRQFEAAVDAMSEHLHTVELGFHVLLADRQLPEPAAHPRKAGAIIFGSDQGLCGKFNEEIVSYAMSEMFRSDDIDERRLIVIGNRAAQLVEPDRDERQPSGLHQDPFGRLVSVDRVFRVPTTVADIVTLVQELLPCIENWRRIGFGRIDVYFNTRSAIETNSTQSFQLVPISQTFLEQCKTKPWNSRGLPTYTMTWNDLVSSVVRQYLFVGLYRACAESRAGENASRLASMRTASKNIDRRLQELRKAFNETRQAAITEEILEIASGFEALSEA